MRVVGRHRNADGEPPGVRMNPFWFVVWVVVIAGLAVWAVVLWVMAIRTLL